jgi:hypothetical protein
MGAAADAAALFLWMALMSVRIRHAMITAMVSLLFLSGCAAPPYAGNGFANLPQLSPLPPAPANRYTATMTPYHITTDTTKQIATQTGHFMALAVSGYHRVTGLEVTTSAPLNIIIYRSQREFHSQLRRHGLPSRATGFYSPRPPAAIQVLWKDRYGTHPYVTLMHEGVHQLSDATTPPFSTTAKSWRTLFPLWLNEGLAVFMEGAIASETALRPGQIQQDRLRHLQTILAEQKVNLAKLLAHPYDKRFTNQDYSVAWGLCFALYHGLQCDGSWSGTNQLPQLIAELQQTARDTPADSSWQEKMAQRSLQWFSTRLAQQGGFDIWQQQWQAAMLRLDPEDPFGGLEWPKQQSP